MEKLVSSWNNVQTVPEKYVFPPEKRPGNVTFNASKSIPVIDLEGIAISQYKESAKALVDSRNPAIFKSFQYKEFITHFINKTGGIDVALEPFKLQA